MPFGETQVGVAVILAVGVAGAPGGGNTVSEVPEETQSVLVFLTVTLYVAGASPVNVAAVWYVLPLMLYSSPAPVGAVITIVPVGDAQVGCTVTLAVGSAGDVGTLLIVPAVEADTQPVVVFLTVTL